MCLATSLLVALPPNVVAFQSSSNQCIRALRRHLGGSTRLLASTSGHDDDDEGNTSDGDGQVNRRTQRQWQPHPLTVSRRRLFSDASASAAVVVGFSSAALFDVTLFHPPSANAVGPTKITLLNPTYSAVPCPRDRPIPGEKAMKGMQGLCVTVTVDLEEPPEKPLEKVGVYGFVTDRGTGESVLANNPDLSTDAGQFAMVEVVNPSDKKIKFEFIAAVPRETVSGFGGGRGGATRVSLGRS